MKNNYMSAAPCALLALGLGLSMPALAQGIMGEPRMFGGRLRYHFGGSR